MTNHGTTLRSLRRKVERFYKKFKSNKSQLSLNNHNHVRHEYSDLLKMTKANYELEKYEQINSLTKCGSKEWWKLINNSLSENTKRKQISTLIKGQLLLTDRNDIAETLNNFFIEQSSTVSEPDEIPKNSIQCNQNSLKIIIVTEQDVNDIIKIMVENKAC